MSKVTSKLQVTIPKAVARQFGISAGSEVFFEPAGPAIRLRVAQLADGLSVAERLALFDAETARQRTRDAARGDDPAPEGRGWTREELFERALPH